MPLRLYNTLTRRLEEFRPADPSRITFYSCGPTVYDDAHIGNFRSFLAADLLRRWLESPLCEVANESPEQRAERDRRGREVVHVMNITDVGHMTDDAEGGEHGEDRMAIAGRRLAEAKKAGKIPAGVEVNPNDPYQIARFYEMRFREDAKRLGLKLAIDAERDPTLMPRATENVAGMIAVIRRLLGTTAPDGQPFAYVTGEPGFRVVYFRVQSMPTYGRLSGNTLDKLREGEGGRVSAQHQQQKKHPADFLLWKEDPRHIMKWESPWGWGYPGWHIECSVMSASRLRAAQGQGPLSPEVLANLSLENGLPLIDLHSGGEDNIFPHHECEIAQSCSAFNRSPLDGTYAGMWFHPRFLLVEGEKMSKSKGNFFTARDLFAKGIEPAALRLELIKTHYRSNANFTMQGLADSQRTIERWRRAMAEPARGSASASGSPGTEARVAFADALNDDLNIAGAIAAINSWTSSGEADPALLARFDAVLGVLSLERPQSAQTSIGVFIGIDHDDRVVSLLEARRDARAAKDFRRSDQIRDELAALGYAIKDMAGGKVEVRRA
ncbi:MAG: cysteine--tRNA ligase [Phycisphaerales bacterium]